jgi:hypothetical protein
VDDMSGPIAQQTSGTYQPSQQRGGTLADVVDLILEKGLVIDLYARVALVGIEILTVDVRIVVASVDTYLRFAEACNRLDLANTGTAQGLPEMVGGLTEAGAGRKTKGALQGAQDKLKETFEPSGGRPEEGRQPARRRPGRKEDEE